MKKTTNAASRLHQRTSRRKTRFDAAHAKGMKALREGDFKALDEAIREEQCPSTTTKMAKRYGHIGNAA